MTESSKFYVLFMIIIVAFVACNQEFEAPKHRVRRHLRFQNNSRIFFRVNVKENILRVNQIFARGFGFRANIDLLQPPRAHRYGPHAHPHKVTKREVLTTIEQLITLNGFDGRACILKMICDAYHKEETLQSGMFFKLFKLIFKHEHSDEYEGVNIPQLLHSGCSNLEQCPFSLLELTQFTDVVY